MFIIINNLFFCCFPIDNATNSDLMLLHICITTTHNVSAYKYTCIYIYYNENFIHSNTLTIQPFDYITFDMNTENSVLCEKYTFRVHFLN